MGRSRNAAAARGARPPSGAPTGASSNGGGEEASTIDSNLPAVYQITSYEGSETGCDQVADVALAPSYLVF